MDWSEVVRRAALVADKQGYITFDQLNALIPQNVAAEDVDRLMKELSTKEIRIEEGIASTSGTEPSCSFCGKTQADVLQLIASVGPFICNECVQLCVGIIGTQNPGWLAQHRQFLGTLPLKPREDDE